MAGESSGSDLDYEADDRCEERRETTMAMVDSLMKGGFEGKLQAMIRRAVQEIAGEHGVGVNKSASVDATSVTIGGSEVASATVRACDASGGVAGARACDNEASVHSGVTVVSRTAFV